MNPDWFIHAAWFFFGALAMFVGMNVAAAFAMSGQISQAEEQERDYDRP